DGADGEDPQGHEDGDGYEFLAALHRLAPQSCVRSGVAWGLTARVPVAVEKDDLSSSSRRSARHLTVLSPGGNFFARGDRYFWGGGRSPSRLGRSLARSAVANMPAAANRITRGPCRRTGAAALAGRRPRFGRRRSRAIPVVPGPATRRAPWRRRVRSRCVPGT